MNYYDVIVCGGGIAGVSAALAASRNNAKVLLIEREYALGGLATLGLIAIYLPLCDGEGEKMSSGISEELLKLSLKYGPGEIPEAWKNKDSNREQKKEKGKRYSLPLRIIVANKKDNLYIAGRCVSADKSGWDLTRVIPSCAVTGEAAGTIAAYQSLNGNKPSIEILQKMLIDNGVLLNKEFFNINK